MVERIAAFQRHYVQPCDEGILGRWGQKPGVAQVFFKRTAFISFVDVLATSTQGSAGDEAKDRILPSFADFSSFVKFAVPKGRAAAGAEPAEEVSDEERGG